MPIVTDSLMESVSEKIIQDILSGKLKAGNYLSSKRQLANKYAVSRTVIDRVLDYLCEMGYLEHEGNASYKVLDFDRYKDLDDLVNFSKFDNQNFSMREIDDIFNLKSGLDYLSIKLVDLPINDKNYEEMKEILYPLSRASSIDEEKNCIEYATIIYDFYTYLAKLSNNVFLPWLYYAFRKTNIHIIGSYICTAHIKNIYKKASSILESLHNGDREEAMKIIDDSLIK